MRPRAKPRQSAQKVRGALKGFADAKKGAGSTLLLGDIRKFVAAEAIRQLDVGREKHLLHVSEITKKEWCPRQSYYKLTHAEPTDVKASHNYRLETIFAAGHKTHAKWQDWLRKMGELWGTWECLMCSHIWEDTSPDCCPSCGRQLIKYNEVTLQDSEFPIVGHADGANEGLHALVEIKSFAAGTVRISDPELVRKATVKTENGKRIVDEAALWKLITRPLRVHLLQSLLYLWMCQRNGLKFDRMIFIYEWKANQDTKEFTVPLTMSLIQPILDKMTALLEDVDTHTVPPRPEGFEKESKPCKDECLFKTKCWEFDDDSSAPRKPVRVRGRGTRGQASAGETADPSPTPTEGAEAEHPRRPDRVDRPGSDAADDPADEVGRVHVDPTGLRGGGRKVRRVSDGERTRTVVTRRSAEERHRAESPGLRE